MIGCINGKLLEKKDSKILILTDSGIGYEVFFPNDKITLLDSSVDLFIIVDLYHV